jgi:GT2 family glycosyltransferase
MSAPARRNLVLWAAMAAVLSAEWWLFAGDVHRRVEGTYPRFWDQVTTLRVAYEAYEHSRANGLALALREVAHRDHPMGLLLPAADLLAFRAAGPSRLHALLPVFAAYAAMQVALVLGLRRRAGTGAALLGLGLTLALAAVYQGAGGLEDVRADLPAACLFAVFLGLALRADALRSARGSALAGLAAAACVALRFIVFVHLGAVLAAFAAVESALWLRARAPEARRAAGQRVRGAAIVGALVLAVDGPLLWLQRDGIGAHYFRGIFGPLRAARAEVAGATDLLATLALYPRMLVGQLGPTWIAAGLLLLGLAAYETARARGQGLRPGPAARLLLLAFVVPLAILTAVTSKSPVVGVLLAAPLLWALPLVADRWRRLRAARGVPADAALLAIAGLVAFQGARVQYRNWRLDAAPLAPAEVDGVFALYDTVARDAEARGAHDPLVSADHVSDHLQGWTLGVSTYERTGRVLPTRLGLGAGIGAVGEADALAMARDSDYLVLTVAAHEPDGPFPADRTLAAARPALLALAERTMRPLGRFRTPGREVALFGRPETTLLPVLPPQGSGLPRVDAFLRSQRAAAVRPTGLTRDAYLDVVLGQVRAFRRAQAPDGTIVDPVAHREWQYATPCYAAAVAALADAGRADPGLLESGLRAMDASVAAMAEYRPADSHGDFYTYPVMTALGLYRGHAAPARLAGWRRAIARVDPYRLYRNTLRGREPIYNWNVVASAGESLRAAAGLAVDPRFTERHLPYQLPHFDENGLYRDPGLPLAYDAFPRYHLTALLAGGAPGASDDRLRDFLWRGAWTSLFMMSGAGESPTGGRSAHHAWNEAQAAAIFETYATAYARSGRPQEAGAFKRAARLSLAALRRFVRDDGSLFVVKNRYPPEARHGYETYSSHSQYNLLAATMLAAAYRAADDAVPELPSPADVGGAALVLPEFHKVFAGAGATSVEYDTFGDPKFNPTGLLRVHVAGGNPQLGPSDGVPAPGLVALGTAWRDAGGQWHRLGALQAGSRVDVLEESPQRVRFRVVYEGMSGGPTRIQQAVSVEPEGVTIEDEVTGPHDGLRVELPALTSDGAETTGIALAGGTVRLSLRGAANQVTLLSPAGTFRRTGETYDHRNGRVEILSAEVSGDRTRYRVSAAPPALSVVLPAFNSGATLARAVDALRAGTFTDFELIVVDDGSDDDTPQVIAGLRPDVHLRSVPNEGPAAARNRGAAVARAPVLFFTDADVCVRPDTLARVAAAFRAPGLQSLVGLYTLDHPHANLASLYKNAWIHHTYAEAPARIGWFFTAVGAVRTDLFRRLGGFTEHLRREGGGSDVEFGQRLAAAGVAIQLDHALQVTHHRRFTLGSLLQNDFRRSAGWTALALGRTGGLGEAARGGVANVRRGFAASALLALALCAGLPVAASGARAAVAWAALACSYLWLNRSFLAFARRSFGPVRAVGFGLLGVADHVACALGMAAGVLGGARASTKPVAADARSEAAP